MQQRVAIAIVGAAMVVCGPAWADDPPVEPAGVGVEVAPEPEPPIAPERLEWLSFGPPTHEGFVGVARHGDSEVIAAITRSGTTWLTRSGGHRWKVALGPATEIYSGSDDEQMMLQVEAHIADLVVPDDDDDLDVVEDPEVLELPGTFDFEGEVLADLDGGQLRLPPEIISVVTTPHVWLLDEQTIVVGRSDGLHMTTDGGGRWRHVIDVPVVSFIKARSNLWVAGTMDGVRLSFDGLGWIDLTDSTEGVPILDLRLDAGDIVAATPSGVWRSVDGQTWRRPDAPVAVTQLGSASAGLLLRQGDDLVGDGLSYTLPPNTRAFAVDGDVLMTAGVEGMSSWSGGEWEVVPGTGGAACSGLWLGERPLAACDGGLYRLGPAGSGDVADVAPEPWIQLDGLLTASLRRVGMSPVDVRGHRWARLLPRFELEAQYGTLPALSWDASGTVGSSGPDFRVMASLTFFHAGRPASVEPSELHVMDGVVWMDEGAGVPSSVVAHVASSGASDRVAIVEEVTALHEQRVRLVATRANMTHSPLGDRVDNELRIEETEARLDALSDGAVSRWKSVRTTSEGTESRPEEER
jgi:hypothetical protein